MRGRVTLAVRGFLVCVGVGAGVEIWECVGVLRGGLGFGGEHLLVPLVLVVGFLAVQLGLVGGAWVRKRVGWWVWWGAVIRWMVLAAAIVGMGEWNASGAVQMWGGLVLIWAGWRVIRGAAREREAAAEVETVSGRDEARVLSYERVSRETAWVGTGMVYLMAVLVGQTLWPAISVLLQGGNRVEPWIRGVYLAPFGLGVPVMGMLMSMVWRDWLRGKPVGTRLWMVAGWGFGVSMVSIQLLLMGLVMAVREGGWTVMSFEMIREAVTAASIMRMGPLAFFVMLVGPAMRGGGEYTREEKGEQ